VLPDPFVLGVPEDLLHAAIPRGHPAIESDQEKGDVLEIAHLQAVKPGKVLIGEIALER
jgi:hypothetical protein